MDERTQTHTKEKNGMNAENDENFAVKLRADDYRKWKRHFLKPSIKAQSKKIVLFRTTRVQHVHQILFSFFLAIHWNSFLLYFFMSRWLLLFVRCPILSTTLFKLDGNKNNLNTETNTSLSEDRWWQIVNFRIEMRPEYNYACLFVFIWNVHFVVPSAVIDYYYWSISQILVHRVGNGRQSMTILKRRQVIIQF